MAGHSRPKDGVLSHAYVPAMTPRVWRARPFNRQSFIFNCQTAARAGMPARVKNMRHHPYCLARPRVGPSSRCLPSKMRGMARQGAQPLFLYARIPSRKYGAPLGAPPGQACARPGLFAAFSLLRRAALFVAVRNVTASVSQLLAGGPYWPPGGAPAPPGCVLCEARPRAPHPAPPRMTPHESAPRWTGRIGLYSV